MQCFFILISFNSDLSQWDVSKVTDVGFIFYYTSSFNSNLRNWNVSNIEYTSGMFVGVTSFDPSNGI